MNNITKHIRPSKISELLNYKQLIELETVYRNRNLFEESRYYIARNSYLNAFKTKTTIERQKAKYMFGYLIDYI